LQESLLLFVIPFDRISPLCVPDDLLCIRNNWSDHCPGYFLSFGCGLPEGKASYLRWHQLRGCCTGFCSRKVFGKPDGAGGIVFLQVCAVDGALQPFGSRSHGPHGDVATAHLDNTSGVFKKRAVPASGLQTPGTDEDTSFNHDRPDADDPVRSGAGTNAQGLSIPDSSWRLLRQTSFCAHMSLY
jgi:hypothetical protein